MSSTVRSADRVRRVGPAGIGPLWRLGWRSSGPIHQQSAHPAVRFCIRSYLQRVVGPTDGHGVEPLPSM